MLELLAATIEVLFEFTLRKSLAPPGQARNGGRCTRGFLGDSFGFAMVATSCLLRRDEPDGSEGARECRTESEATNHRSKSKCRL
jgi:hypothetical protein